MYDELDQPPAAYRPREEAVRPLTEDEFALLAGGGAAGFFTFIICMTLFGEVFGLVIGAPASLGAAYMVARRALTPQVRLMLTGVAWFLAFVILIVR